MATTQEIKSEEMNPRGWRFWLIFLALCISLFLSALDLASVATALPVIVHELQGTDSFAWVSTAYTLGSAAVLPLSGRLAEIFGRRPTLLGFLVMFAVGSILSASAHTMGMLVAGRTIQGVGSGGIQSLTAIVVADLTSLRERGIFNAIIGATFSFASAIGPFIGGAIAQKTSWRWLFYINLPLCAVAIVFILFFLKLKNPTVTSVPKALLALDWVGNILIIASASSCAIALTWAGVVYPWQSVQVLLPLILGLIGLACFVLYEVYVASSPSMPIDIISNRTSLSGYLGSFLHGMVMTSVAFYLPAYFQATKTATPLLSGLYIFPMALSISPSAIIQGIMISKTGRYRLVNLIGWCAMFVGVGLLCILGVDTPIGECVPFQIIAAIGFGFLYATTFSVLAPLDVSLNAQALSCLLFARTFSQSWSIAIGATVLQNQLEHRLPRTFLATFPKGQNIAYLIIPDIVTLPEPLQGEVRAAFAGSLVVLWRVLLAFCALGLFSVALQKDLPLHTATDRKWGVDDSGRVPNVEEGQGSNGEECLAVEKVPNP